MKTSLFKALCEKVDINERLFKNQPIQMKTEKILKDFYEAGI